MNKKEEKLKALAQAQSYDIIGIPLLSGSTLDHSVKMTTLMSYSLRK